MGNMFYNEDFRLKEVNMISEGLIGLFMPVLIELVKTKLPDKRWLSYSIALGSSIIIGGLTAWLSNQLDAGSVLGSIGIVFATSQSAYNYWWKDSKLAKKIKPKKGLPD